MDGSNKENANCNYRLHNPYVIGKSASPDWGSYTYKKQSGIDSVRLNRVRWMKLLKYLLTLSNNPKTF